MSRAWLVCVVFAWTWIGAHRDARAQTVIYVPEVNLYVPIDPALITPNTKTRKATVVPIGWLQSASDDSVEVRVIADVTRTLDVDFPDRKTNRVHTIARPEWAPADYEADAWDFNYDGSDVEVYLRTSGGWLFVRVFNASRDLTAVSNVLAGLVNATATLPAGAVLYGTTPTVTEPDPVEPVQTKKWTVAGDLDVVVDAYWSDFQTGGGFVYTKYSETAPRLDFRHASPPCADEMVDDGQRVARPTWAPTGFYEWATDTGAGIEICVARPYRSLIVLVTNVETDEDDVTAVLEAIATAASAEIADSHDDPGTPTSPSYGAPRKSIFPLGIEVDLDWRITSPSTAPFQDTSVAGIGVALHKSGELARANAYLALGLEVDGSLGYDATYALAYDARAALAVRGQLEVPDILRGGTSFRGYLALLVGAGGDGVTATDAFEMPGAAYWFWGLTTVMEMPKRGMKMFLQLTFAHRSVDGAMFEDETRFRFGATRLLAGWGLSAEMTGVGGILAEGNQRELLMTAVAVSHGI